MAHISNSHNLLMASYRKHLINLCLEPITPNEVDIGRAGKGAPKTWTAKIERKERERERERFLKSTEREENNREMVKIGLVGKSENESRIFV